MGFDADRGDRVEIVNLQFAPSPTFDAGTEAPADEGFMNLTGADVMRIVEMAVIAILAVIAMLFVFRPLMARLGSAPSRMSAALAPPGSAGAAALAMAGGEDGNASAGALPAPELSEDMMIDIAQVAGKVKQSSVRKIGELVTGHPDESISILRSWLHESA